MEILFRGKRVDDGEWVCGMLCNVFKDGELELELAIQISDEFEMLAYPVIPETVGQYTGLDDKNGVKIFEGDIVREHVNDYTPIYQNGIYMAYNVDKINDPYVSTQFNIIWRNGCEVIGNIHDNQELLDG